MNGISEKNRIFAYIWNAKHGKYTEEILCYMNFKAVILSGKNNKNGKTNIKIRVIHRGKVREIGTDYYIEPDYFDMENFQVRAGHPNASYLNYELKKKILEYEKKVMGANTASWHISRVVEFLKKQDCEEVNLFDYFESLIERKNLKSRRTGEIYAVTLQKMRDFWKRNYLSFEEVDKRWLEQFDRFMLLKGNDTNTRSIDMRNLRHLFNSALDDELTTRYPFRKFKIQSRIESSTHPLSVEQLKKIRDFSTDEKHLAVARDVFMISFYLIGMNVSDLYEQPRESVGRVRYKRHKTGRYYSVLVPPEMNGLMDAYADDERLFNFFRRYKSLKSFTGQVNKNLKIIGEAIGEPSLILYHARHSWATLAASVDIPREIISEALGHSVKTVTDIYIKFDFRKIDDANRKVVALLN